MARIACLCGNELSNSNTPGIQYMVHNDSEWIELATISENQKGAVLDHGRPRITFWKCNICNRIVFFERKNDKPLQWYKPEITNNKNW